MTKLKKIILDNLGFILCLIFSTLILFLNSPLIKAEELDEKFDYGGLSSPFALANGETSPSGEIELDFSKIENPWNLNEKILFTIPTDFLSRNFVHISVNSSGKELLLYSYDYELSESNNKLVSSIKQNIYLKVYHYDTSISNFKFDHNWTFENVTSIDYYPVVYSNYDLLLPTKFPDWTYQYEYIKKIFDADSYKKEIMEKLIIKLNEKKCKFIITFGLNERFYIKISKNNEEFNLDYKTLSFSSDLYTLNNASGLSSGDLFYLNELTEKKIDEWLNSFDNEKEKLAFGTLGFPFWSYPVSGFDTNIVLFSSFGNDFEFSNLEDNILIDNKIYKNKVPTFNSYYENYFEAPTYIPDDEEYPFDHLLKPGVDFDPGDPLLDEDFESNSENSFSKMINNLLHMLDVYFPILNQVDEIIDAWKFNPTKQCFMTEIGPYGYIYYKKCKLIPNINLHLWGHDYDLEGIDVTWFLGYRKWVEFFVKLIVGVTTFLKCFKIVQGMFRN